MLNEITNKNYHFPISKYVILWPILLINTTELLIQWYLNIFLNHLYSDWLDLEDLYKHVCTCMYTHMHTYTNVSVSTPIIIIFTKNVNLFWFSRTVGSGQDKCLYLWYKSCSTICKNHVSTSVLMSYFRKTLLINHEGIIPRIHCFIKTGPVEGSFLENWHCFFYDIIWELTNTQKGRKT